MSASREKKTRQNLGDQILSEKELKAQKDAKTAKRNRIIYTIIGVVAAVAVAALLIWDSGILEKGDPAVTINGTDYSAADLSYYYLNTYSNLYTYASMGLYDYDVSASPKDQMYNEEEGQTWYDYLVSQATDALTQAVALYNEAQAQGYTLPDEGKEEVESELASLDDSWPSRGYTNRESYIRALYGADMSYSKLKECMTRDVTASYYATEYYNNLTSSYSDEDLEAYYQENADTLDTYDYSYLTFHAEVATTDADGNTIEMTDEEKADELEKLRQEAQAQANEAQQRYENGESLSDIIADMAPYNSVEHQVSLGSSLSADLSEWLQDAGRQAEDTNVVEYNGTDRYNYYMVVFHDRFLDESATADIRHILVSAGSDPTEEEYETAKTEAQALLDQWKADGATEDAFAQLAMEHSADTSSAQNGGLMTGVSAYAGYVDTFTDWALDESRQAGDTGLVQNTGSSTKGWHIMYFVGWGDPYWKLSVKSTLADTDTQAWLDELVAACEVSMGPAADNLV